MLSPFGSPVSKDEVELQPRRWSKEESPAPNELTYEVDGQSSTDGKSDDGDAGPTQRSRTAISPRGLFYMALLALQYGSQPLITTTFTPR